MSKLMHMAAAAIFAAVAAASLLGLATAAPQLSANGDVCPLGICLLAMF